MVLYIVRAILKNTWLADYVHNIHGFIFMFQYVLFHMFIQGHLVVEVIKIKLLNLRGKLQLLHDFPHECLGFLQKYIRTVEVNTLKFFRY